MGYTALEALHGHLIPLPSVQSGQGSFPGLVLPSDTIDSELVVGVKPDKFGVVLGYQVDNFMCT